MSRSTSADPRSIRQLARQHGLRASTVSERLRRGWTLDQALGTPAAERHGKRTGLAEAARAAGIGRTTVRKRLAAGAFDDAPLAAGLRRRAGR